MEKKNYNKVKDILINIENLNKRINTLEEYGEKNLTVADGSISICFADFPFKSKGFMDIKLPSKLNAEFINFLINLSKNELIELEKELKVLLN